MADTSYTLPLSVSLYDLDLREQVSCATLFRYFEETAMRGSAHFGFTLEWYRARRQFWVIRTMQLERTCAPGYLEDLVIRTWVSSMSRVRSDRNYEARRAKDGHLMARGIANWVFVDAASMAPASIPGEIRSMFDRQEPPALPPLTRLTFAPHPPPLLEFRSRRHASFYEADSAQHINNAVYVDWLEETVREALRTQGDVLLADGFYPLPWFYRHALEYARPALPGEELEIQARLARRGRTAGEWNITICESGSGAELLRARTTMLWVDQRNRPVPWPAIS